MTTAQVRKYSFSKTGESTGYELKTSGTATARTSTHATAAGRGSTGRVAAAERFIAIPRRNGR
jgi:hypothetical protein